jgi:hypothetical protein
MDCSSLPTVVMGRALCAAVYRNAMHLGELAPVLGDESCNACYVRPWSASGESMASTH